MKTWISTIVLSSLVAWGSAMAQDSATAETRFSGFLGDYSRLQPAPDREGILLFIDRTGDYRSFRKIMFDPPEVFLAPNPDYRGLQPDTLKRMTDNFVAAFKRALEPEYQVVTEPGPDVLRVRSAIPGVQLVKPPIKPTDIIPASPFVRGIGALVSPRASWIAAGVSVIIDRTSYSRSRARGRRPPSGPGRCPRGRTPGPKGGAVAADPERVTDEQGISMRTFRTMLIFSAFLAHVAIAQASAMTPDAGTTIARAETQAAAGQPADASTSAATDKPKQADARSRVRAMWTSKADLRYCLDRKSNEAIIRCAEGLD